MLAKYFFLFFNNTRISSEDLAPVKCIKISLLSFLIPQFTKYYFGPDSIRSLYMVDRPHIWESNRGLADNHGQSPGKVGEGLAQSPQSYKSRVPKK